LSEKQFNGAYSPRNIAKWEAEIHQIGRQMIGTLDSKMVALQTLTQEANRVANRIELLLERFEQLTETQFQPKVSQNEEKIPPKPPENLPYLIPANTTELPAKSLVLNDLHPDQLQQPNTANETRETIPHATILKVETLKVEALKNENKPEKLPHSAEPLEQQQLPPTISFSSGHSSSFGLSSAELADTNHRTKSSYYEKPKYSPEITNNSLRHGVRETPAQIKPLQKPENLSLGSLYDDGLATREHGKIFAVATTPHTNYTTTTNSQHDSQHDLQKQIKMLDNYGYTPRQIAQSLNITVGEVDLLLKLKDEK
jgi:hypothetical protein